MTIKLYELRGLDEANLFSPHCWKIRMSLAHKGLNYESIPVNFTDVATLEGGANRTVPVIRDGDTVLHESFAIAKYLEEKYPDRPSLFDGDGGIALTKFIINWSQANIHPAVAKLCLINIHNSLDDENQAFFRTSREKVFGVTLEEFDAKFPKNDEELMRVLVPLGAILKGQKYLGGETPLFADYIVFGALQWLRMCCPYDVLPKEGRIAEWLDSLLDMYDGMGRSAPTARTS